MLHVPLRQASALTNAFSCLSMLLSSFARRLDGVTVAIDRQPERDVQDCEE